MIFIWTRLTRWGRRIASARWWRDDPNASSFPPHIQAQIDATVERLEANFTERAVTQIQAELRAAAAEDRLADYTAAWLQRSVAELSADLLRLRHMDRTTAAAGPAGRSA